MSDNPFQTPNSPHNRPPNSQYNKPPPRQRVDESDKLKAPAICLIIVTILSILNVASGPFVNVAMGVYQVGSTEFIIASVAAVLICLFQFAILVSAIFMLQKKSLVTCRTGAIISCIPICSPCLIIGIPFGIWALVLLSKPEVQKGFSS